MPTLQELQAADTAQGKAQLQTLLLEFSATLARLPSLQRELQSWLKQDAHTVDYHALSTRAETALVAATDWLLDYDLLKPEVKQSAAMQEFMRTVAESVTCRTVVGVVQKFKTLPDEIQCALKQARKVAQAEKEKQAAEEAKRKQIEKAEKEKQVAREAERKAFELELKLRQSDGVSIDSRTNLMWKKQSEGVYTWDDAIRRFKGINNYLDYSDWRLPTIDELKTLQYFEHFPDSIGIFWSSSPFGADSAWRVNFEPCNGGSGIFYNHRKCYFAVRLIRSCK